MKRILPLTALGSLLLSVGAGTAVSFLLTRYGQISPSLATGAAFMTLLGLFLLILVVEIVSAFKIEGSTYHTVLIAGCLLALYAFSADSKLFMECNGGTISPIVFGISSEIAFVLSEACCCWYLLYLYGIAMNGKLFAAVSLSSMFATLAEAVSLIYGFGYIAHFVNVGIFACVICLILRRAAACGKVGLSTYIVALLFSLSAGVQSINTLCYDGVVTAAPGVTLVYAALSLCLFLAVYLAFSVHADLLAGQSDEYRSEALSFKTKALAWQIKPHFIFNSLEAVRSLYQHDVKSGDAAIGLLSDLLRGSIHAFDCELVPFETELDNIFNYTEFENLKRPHKIEVLFDTDFTDFSVPPFSVLTYVENAVKHSGVDEKEDGRIVISSRENGDRVLLEIYDNGKGFDPSEIRGEAHGLQNAAERFRMTLSAVPRIASKIGEGTRITVEFPCTSKEKSDEDRGH